MRFESLRIHDLRCLEQVELAFGPGLNFLLGPNGAGKTSVLEAAYLLSHGRSFRAGGHEALRRRGARTLIVHARIVSADGHSKRLGLSRDEQRWQARLDGETARSLGEFLGHCSVVCFEPGTHALVSGPSDLRRRYLDWGVFHVEPSFLELLRRYQRALKQRNWLLRAQGPRRELEPWEHEMAAVAEPIDRQRHLYMERLRPHLKTVARQLLPELGSMQLEYRPGWTSESSFTEQLSIARERDYRRGFTGIGPQRADWTLRFEHAPRRWHLSRGQEKLVALACVLAQAALHGELAGQPPAVCLDDLASELDQEHLAIVVQQLRASDAQVLMTGTDLPSCLEDTRCRMFHVEHGQIQQA